MGHRMLILAIMVLGLCAPSWLQAEGPLPVIKGIRLFKAGENFGVEISADKGLEYTTTKMPQLLKVVVDLPRTEFVGPNTVYKYKSALVSRIWLEKKTVNGVMISRVSVHLSEDADYETQATPDGKKVTVVFRKHAPGSSAQAAATPGSADAKGSIATGKAAATVAAAPLPVAAAPVAVAKHEANRPITVTEVDCGPDSIEIKTGSSIREYKAFTLEKPGRLVIDIPDAETTLRAIVVPRNGFGILKARIAPFEGKLRLVFDAGDKPFPDYDLLRTPSGLRVVRRGAPEGRK